MTGVINFFKKNKYAVIWTACYVFVMWAILKWMFNFDMTSLAQWKILFHAHLRGFPGFVFGILILAAIPLYIATTSIILRTKKPLFTLSLPKFMQPVPDDTSATAAPEPVSPEPVDTTPTDTTPQKIIPTELRPAFVRARVHGGAAPKSAFDISNITAPHNTSNAPATTPELQPAGELPLPNNFELVDATPSFAPVFSDINFDDDTPTADTANIDTDTNIAQSAPPQSVTPDITPVTDYLTSNGIEFKIENDVIITPTDAIAAHNDPDFWIADDTTWFAAGRQKPSPADTVLAIATERNIRPVLYLGQTNILDLDARREQWTTAGITVITDLNELKQS